MYYTTKQIAKKAGVQPVTVRAWIAVGKIRAVKFGRDWKIKDCLELRKVMARGK